MSKKRNQAIVNAEIEFYNKGFEIGFEQGVEVSRVAAELIFAKKINELKNVKGVGPKTFDIFAKHFEDYLKEVPDEHKEAVQSTKNIG